MKIAVSINPEARNPRDTKEFFLVKESCPINSSTETGSKLWGSRASISAHDRALVSGTMSPPWIDMSFLWGLKLKSSCLACPQQHGYSHLFMTHSLVMYFLFSVRIPGLSPKESNMFPLKKCCQPAVCSRQREGSWHGSFFLLMFSSTRHKDGTFFLNFGRGGYKLHHSLRIETQAVNA